MKNSKIDRYWKIFFNWLKEHYDLIIVLGIYLIIFSLFLTDLPKLMTDEPWIGNGAKILFNRDNQILGLFGNKINAFLFPPYLFFIALVFKIFGVGVLQGRMVSVIFGAGALIFLYLMARKIYNRQIAYLAAIFFTLNPLVFGARIIRPEILVTMIMVAVVYFYLVARDKKNKYLFFLTGLLLILGIGSHPHASFILPTLVLLFFWDSGKAFYKKRNFQYFIFGILSGLLVFIIWFLINNIKILDLRQEKVSYLSRLRIFSLTDIKDNILAEIKRWRTFAIKFKFLEYLWITSLGYLLISFRQHRILLTSIFFILLGLIFIDSYKWFQYLVILTPFFSLAMALFFDKIIKIVHQEISRNRFRRKLTKVFYVVATSLVLTIFLYFGSNTFWTIRTLAEPRHSYYNLISEMQKAIKPDDNILGSTLYWYGFNNQNYLSSHFICEFPQREYLKKEYGYNWQDLIAKQKIDIIIYDENFADKFDHFFAQDENFSWSNFEKFIKKHCKKTLELRDEFYAKNKPIIIYRVIK